MLAPDLLALLRCPETRQKLALASPEQLAECDARARRSENGLRNRRGDAVQSPLAGLLLREDGKVAYPVQDGIPILLTDEAILL